MAKQDQCRSRHPDEENQRVGCISLTSAGKYAQHLVLKLDADLNQVGITNRVDPEGAVDLFGDLFAQDAIENGKEWLRTRCGQRICRENRNIERQSLSRNPDQIFIALILWIGIHQVNDASDITYHRCRQALRNSLPMALHEDKSNNGLK